MEEATELASYLPLSFKSEKEEEYIRFLWDAFETNQKHGKYQFAFLAYHMLTMSFVYFNIWQIKQAEPKDFAKGLIGFGKDIENSLLEATSPFVFSTVNERSILRVLKLIGCDNGKIGTYAKLVDDRNETAHSNGNIFFNSQAALDGKITEILRVVDEIQNHSKPVIEHCYREFLLQNHDPEEREYPDATDQIQEILIHKNYLSQKDIAICCAYDTGSHATDPNSHPMSEELADKLARRAEAVFAHHPDMQRLFKSASGRAAILMFMRHWLAGVLAKEHPALFRQLPESFKIGRPLPEKPCSSGRESAPSSRRRNQSRFTSVATVPGRNIRPRFVHGCELLAV